MAWVHADALERFGSELLVGKGVRSDVAHHVAAGLVLASLRGVDSHGIRLLPHYVRALQAGRLNPDPMYRFDRTATATGRLDADDTFGLAAGAEGMRHAVEMAGEAGMGAVAVRNSSHFGMAAYFALMAARQDMIGLAFTHADALMLSHNGSRAFFGTNPICFAAPCQDEEPFCLDMATTTVTWNKMLRVGEIEKSVPLGWGVDSEGIDTQDPARVTALYPIGDYKGFGLGMMVEILCSLLTGMPFGRDISRMYADPIESKRHLGHFFMAFQVDRFVDLVEFKSRIRSMMGEVRSEPPRDGEESVQVPGDPEKLNVRERTQTGLPLADVELQSLRDLADESALEFPNVSESPFTHG
jgi:ureidoglycolate dehydrogenase (NAD+)